jgi:pyruvate-formate lyase
MISIRILAEMYVIHEYIHYMHDKYAYEASQALHDTKVERLMVWNADFLSQLILYQQSNMLK